MPEGENADSFFLMELPASCLFKLGMPDSPNEINAMCLSDPEVT